MQTTNRMHERHGDFVVYDRAASDHRGYATWRLMCPQGHRIVVSAKNLVRERSLRRCPVCR